MDILLYYYTVVLRGTPRLSYYPIVVKEESEEKAKKVVERWVIKNLKEQEVEILLKPEGFKTKTPPIFEGKQKLLIYKIRHAIGLGALMQTQ